LADIEYRYDEPCPGNRDQKPAPVIATNFGLGAVIEIAGLAYLLALPAFFGVIAVDKFAAPG